MIAARFVCLASLVALGGWGTVANSDERASGRLPLTVRAGKHDRKDTPVRFEIPEAALGNPVRKALEAGPVGLTLRPAGGGPDLVAQVDRPEGRGPRVTFTLPGPLAAGSEAKFILATDAPASVKSPWSLTPSGGGLELVHGKQPVFKYNTSPVSNAKYPPIQTRDGYIHPAYSPSGALITGDYSVNHPHHRGFFLAYTKTKSGEHESDYWNIHQDKGKIFHDGVLHSAVGPVTASFATKHKWVGKGKDVTLRERWDVEAIEVPGANYWLFDITSTQQAEGHPMELPPYRYGGMAYRGPEPWLKGTLDVLTNENRHRVDGDQKPAKWMDLTGPISEGSSTYAGAMMADHPSNINHPTVIRVHPTKLPFFSYVPSHDKKVVIPTDTPTVFKYRVLIHDGRPDKALDDRIWRDFAEPPVVSVGEK